MEIKRTLKIINSFLLVAFVLSVSNFLQINPEITGNFYKDNEEASCTFKNGDFSNEVPVDRCCLQASQKQSCNKNNDRKVCGTETQNLSLNQKAVNYCNERGFSLE